MTTSLRERVQSPASENQLALFSQGDRLRRRFEEFHAARPEVYRDLVALAREAKRRGWRRVGIRLLWEKIRWEYGPHERGDDGFALNDHLHSMYARVIQEREKDLAGFFETRQLRSEP